jgi:hypothetical protein
MWTCMWGIAELYRIVYIMAWPGNLAYIELHGIISKN